MINHHWSFSIEQMRLALGLQRLLVMNDFAALALALPDLAGDQRRLICGGTLCASTAREWVVLQCLQARFGHASAERAVSGQGLVWFGLAWVYQALCSLDGVAVPAQLSAAQISAAAITHSEARADETLELFFAFLGAMAGSLALTLGARDGLCLGSGSCQDLRIAWLAPPFNRVLWAKVDSATTLRPSPLTCSKLRNHRHCEGLRGRSKAKLRCEAPRRSSQPPNLV